MSRSPRHEPVKLRRPRLLALPLVLVCALAYLGSAAHFFLVQHAPCLEHGDMLHAVRGEQGGALERVQPSFADERLAQTDAPVSVHGADAHCTHVFLRRVVQPSVGVTLLPEAPVVSGPGLEVDSVAVEPPVAWLRLAPKSSPPRA